MYYAVRVGRKVGIFNTLEECEEQIYMYPNAQYNSFEIKDDALNYIKYYLQDETPENPIKIIPFTSTCLLKIPIDELKIFEIYINGACIGKLKLRNAGIGLYVPHNNSLNISCNLAEHYGSPYNIQRAKLAGVYLAIKMIYKFKFRKGIIYTDSSYIVNIINNWMNKWIKKDWKRSDGISIIDSDIIKDIQQLYNETKQLDYRILIKYIPENAQIPENRRAYDLARISCYD
jgi:ribonuclease HI